MLILAENTILLKYWQQNTVLPLNVPRLVCSLKVDAAFDAKVSSLTTQLEVNSEEILSCGIAGSSFMMRKDNGFADWWNPAFEKLRATSEFRKICEGLTGEHGKPARQCLPPNPRFKS